MVQVNRSTTLLVATAMVMTSSLLAGCSTDTAGTAGDAAGVEQQTTNPQATAPPGSGTANPLVPPSTATPSSETTASADTSEMSTKTEQTEQTEPVTTEVELETDNLSTCLIGTWKEDMDALGEAAVAASKLLGGDGSAGLTWGGDGFLRFNADNKFYNWVVDGTFVAKGIDPNMRTIVNAAGGGDYAVVDGLIQWANWSVSFADAQTFEDGKLTDEYRDETFGNYSVPSSVTCTQDTLEVTLGGDDLALPRVFDRVSDIDPVF